MQTESLRYIPASEKHSVLQTFFTGNWAILLDSGVSELSQRSQFQINSQDKKETKRQSSCDYCRFDIFTSDPSVKFELQNNEISVIGSSRNHEIDKYTPLESMRKILNDYIPDYLASNSSDEVTEQLDIPFHGGWVGYISYDFGVDNILNSTVKPIHPEISDIPKNSEIPRIRMGLYQWALITDHLQKTTNLYNFGLDESEWKILLKRFYAHSFFNNLVNSKKQQLPNNRNKISEDFKLTSPFESNMNFKIYSEAFATVRNYIIAGDCYQVNLAQRFDATYSGSSFQAYSFLCKENDSPFSAFLDFPDFQIISLSPERFIESHQGLVTTQPIKGTLPRNKDPKIDKHLAKQLINSEKDRAENLMIVDLLRNDLSRTSKKNSVKVKELFGHYQFESVHHLISTITSELSQQHDNFDLLQTTLPGGSITGAPKKRAMEIISELERYPREIYCGIIGFIDFKGNMDTNICIRTLLARKNKLTCWAGGGLVHDSTAKQEYQETFDKISKIIPPLHNEYFDSEIEVPSPLLASKIEESKLV